MSSSSSLRVGSSFLGFSSTSAKGLGMKSSYANYVIAMKPFSMGGRIMLRYNRNYANCSN